MENLKFIVRIVFNRIAFLTLIGVIGLIIVMFIDLCINIVEDEITFERSYNYHDNYTFSPRTKARLIVLSFTGIIILILFLFFWAYS